MHPIHNITPIEPKIEFITLIKAKEHLKIDFDHENDLITGMIDAAVSAAENYMGVMLHHREISLRMNGFAPCIDLNYGPYVDGTLAVTYKTVFDTVLPFVDYEVADSFGEKTKLIHIGENGFPIAKTAFDAVTVKYTAGYTLATIPTPIMQAIYLQLSDFYEFRTDRKDITNTRAMALMRPYKIFN